MAEPLDLDEMLQGAPSYDVRALVERLRELEDRTCATCKHWIACTSDVPVGCRTCSHGVRSPVGQNNGAGLFGCSLHESMEATECPGNTTDGT